MASDWSNGIPQLPEEYPVNGSMWRRGMHARFKLTVRTCEILTQPYEFSEYSQKFATVFGEQYILPDNIAEFLTLSDDEKKQWYFRQPLSEEPTEPPF